MLQPTNVAYPDGTSLTNFYALDGQLRQTAGSRAYLVGFSFDGQGRQKTMTNWTNFATGGGVEVTTWNYDGYRGWLTNKQDNSGNGPSYTYTAAGRLASRLWARGTNTTYTTNAAGDLATIVYNNGTPGVTNTYDRLGRLSTVLCGLTTTTRTYDSANDLLSETNSGGTLDKLSITNGYDAYLRRSNSVVFGGGGVLSKTTNSYDGASRSEVVSDGTNTATYSYLANSMLVSNIVFQQSGTTRMNTTRQYDYLNRLTSTVSSPSNSFAYAENSANQRTRATLADGSYWVYGYDSLGQNTSGKKYFWDGTPVAGEQFGYTFDTIGNRTQTQAGGDQNGANFRVASYTNNLLNQITSRGVPGDVDVFGLSLATNTVQVNSTNAYQKWEYFREQMATNNTSAAQYVGINVTAPGQATNSGYVFVAKTPEYFTNDADGNQTQDGRWTYTWDGENRLIDMTSLAGPPTASLYKLDFTYDWMGRRIQKIVSTNSGSGYVAQYTNIYLYDGWNPVAIVTSNNLLAVSLVWGTDLSGSMQGAGGVGGLLMENLVGNGVHFVTHDGNGNVSALVSATNSAMTANYEYGPFHELLRVTGPVGKLNPIGCSDKISDWESGLVCYPFRYYNPPRGGWLSRDPAGEDEGGPNLYGFVGNAPINNIDPFGLWLIERDPTEDWAPAIAQLGDTVQSLANLIHLDVSEAAKWLKGWNGGDINACTAYEIPNTVVVYTSEPGLLDTELTYVEYCRHQAVSGGRRYADHNYHLIWKLGGNSDDLFKSLWQTDGIFAYFFGGHGGVQDGVNYGFGASPGSAVSPGEVQPPYKLQAIGAFSCESALGITYVPPKGDNETVYWKDLVSKAGLFEGYNNDVWWGNARQSFIVINPQPIPQ